MTKRWIALALAGALAGAAPAVAQGHDGRPEDARRPEDVRRPKDSRREAVVRRAEEIRRQAVDRRPFEALLRHQRALALSEAQVRRLEAIGRGLEARNAPLRQRLTEERLRWMQTRRAELERMSPGRRRAEIHRMRGEREMPERMRATAEQMRRNITDATHQAHAVLTPEQRLRARGLLRRELERRPAEPRHSREPGRPAPDRRPRQ